MPISVEISDRLYDYTDEEAACEAIMSFQETHELSEAEIITIWNSGDDPRRAELEACILDAVDQNGSVKRAAESVPCGISIILE